jgi:periplasmic copper chaperone A
LNDFCDRRALQKHAAGAAGGHVRRRSWRRKGGSSREGGSGDPVVAPKPQAAGCRIGWTGEGRTAKRGANERQQGTRVTKATNMGAIAVAVAVLLLGVALVAGRFAHSAPAQLVVSDATVRLPVVPGRPAAGYFTVNGGAQADRLLSVASPMARIEMHETVMANGAMRMAPMKSAAVSAGGRVAFEPGGKHLMIYGLPAEVRPGAVLTLTFTFERAGAVPVRAVARSATDAADPHAHH